jgi:hypothetical protein
LTKTTSKSVQTSQHCYDSKYGTEKIQLLENHVQLRENFVQVTEFLFR